MKFGLSVIGRAVRGFTKATGRAFSSVGSGRGNWWPLIREPFSGAWQQNIEWTTECVLAHHAVYACITLIASDIGKLRPRLVTLSDDGIWTETNSAAFSPVLRKPNRYQNHIQFKEWWITSKLVKGNAYGLKERDARGVVVRIHILDPSRVTVLVSPDGEVYYQLGGDNLVPLTALNGITVPASEIIHDRMNCLFHPLVGVSPLFASGLAAYQGLEIQKESTRFFGNGARPSGILTAPGAISEDTAKELKDYWNSNFTGENSGKVAVLGDGLKFEAMRMSAEEAQMIQQLEWTAVVVCGTFHVPAYKIGVGPAPTNNNIEALDQQYYSQCLQVLIEEFELCMDEGLGIGWGVNVEGRTLGVELDLDGLLRMDTATQVKTLAEGLKGIYKTNEARKKLNLPPVVGGDQVLAQQQNYSLEALAKRDAKDDPFSSGATAASPAPAPVETDEDDEEDATQARALADALINKFMAASHESA